MVYVYSTTFATPVFTSIVHGLGSGSHNFPLPISSGIQRYRESHCASGFQMSPMKMTVVAFSPTTFNSIVDCEPYVLVAGGAMSLNSDHGPASDLAVAYLFGFGLHPVNAEPIA